MSEYVHMKLCWSRLGERKVHNAENGSFFLYSSFYNSIYSSTHYSTKNTAHCSTNDTSHSFS